MTKLSTSQTTTAPHLPGIGHKRPTYTIGAVIFILLLLLAGTECFRILMAEVFANG